ncbi:hypothetical protein O1L60_21915 [Streptomyces diastatochromogenes]|nr:hypothetical protein [Streptomyces diastatochromogenes]
MPYQLIAALLFAAPRSARRARPWTPGPSSPACAASPTAVRTPTTRRSSRPWPAAPPRSTRPACSWSPPPTAPTAPPAPPRTARRGLRRRPQPAGRDRRRRPPRRRGRTPHAHRRRPRPRPGGGLERAWRDIHAIAAHAALQPAPAAAAYAATVFRRPPERLPGGGRLWGPPFPRQAA